jgi:hypothetical protein
VTHLTQGIFPRKIKGYEHMYTLFVLKLDMVQMDKNVMLPLYSRILLVGKGMNTWAPVADSYNPSYLGRDQED